MKTEEAKFVHQETRIALMTNDELDILTAILLPNKDGSSSSDVKFQVKGYAPKNNNNIKHHNIMLLV